MHVVTATSQRQLQSALEVLATRLEGASITRSAIEDVVRALGGGSALRTQIERNLIVAEIELVEDMEVDRAGEIETAPTTATMRTLDPREIGRERLEKDRGRPSHRLAKVILKAEEEVALTLLARPDAAPLEPGGFAFLTGESRAAAESMLLHNMGLIHSVAQRLGGRGLEYDDLVASGVHGLVRAIELFDPGRGLKFSTYATHWVRQSISRAIANEGRIIRLPVHIIDAIHQVKSAQERLTVNGKMPRWSEIARECHMSVDRVEELLRLAPTVMSLDTPVGNDGITLGELLDRPARAHDPVEVNGLDGDDLRVLLGQLDEREADVLRRRNGLHPYVERQTLDEIGAVYGVTRERIRQVERKALTNIRMLLGLEQASARKKRKPALAQTA